LVEFFHNSLFSKFIENYLCVLSLRNGQEHFSHLLFISWSFCGTDGLLSAQNNVDFFWNISYHFHVPERTCIHRKVFKQVGRSKIFFNFKFFSRFDFFYSVFLSYVEVGSFRDIFNFIVIEFSETHMHNKLFFHLNQVFFISFHFKFE